MNQPGLLLLIIMWLKCGFRGRLNLLRERQSLNNVTRAVQGLRMSPERPFKKNNVFLAMLRSLTGFQAWFNQASNGGFSPFKSMENSFPMVDLWWFNSKKFQTYPWNIPQTLNQRFMKELLSVKGLGMSGGKLSGYVGILFDLYTAHPRLKCWILLMVHHISNMFLTIPSLLALMFGIGTWTSFP